MSEKMQYSDEQIKSLLNGILDGTISEYLLPKDLYLETASYLKKALYSGFGGNLTDFSGKDLELLTELRENIYMFSSAKTFQEVKEITSLMFDEKGDLISNREFNKLGAETFDKWNSDYGRTEYNTARGQGAMAVKWNEIEKNKDLLPILVFDTNGNACAECAPYEGFAAPVEDSVWDWLCPLLHFNCECVLQQEEEGYEITGKEDYEKIEGSKEDISPMFRMNPGKDKVVFNEAHPYFDVAKKDIPFAKENFGLPIPSVEEETGGKVKGFIEAKTIGEVKERMISAGVKNPAIDDWSVAHANQMLKAIEVAPKKAIPTVITDKKGFESLVSNKIKRKEKEWMGLSINSEVYNKTTREFNYEKFVVINSKGFKTPEAMTAKKIEYNKFYSGVKPGSKWYYNEFDGSTHFHELGHVYDNGFISQKQEWIDISDKWHKATSVDLLKVSAGSDFKNKNGSEAFAEAFASYYGNNKIGLPDYIINYFDKNIR